MMGEPQFSAVRRLTAGTLKVLLPRQELLSPRGKVSTFIRKFAKWQLGLAVSKGSHNKYCLTILSESVMEGEA